VCRRLSAVAASPLSVGVWTRFGLPAAPLPLCLACPPLPASVSPRTHWCTARLRPHPRPLPLPLPRPRPLPRPHTRPRLHLRPPPPPPPPPLPLPLPLPLPRPHPRPHSHAHAHPRPHPRPHPHPKAVVVRGLPAGWRAALDEAAGRVFYWNTRTWETTWARPVPPGGPLFTLPRTPAPASWAASTRSRPAGRPAGRPAVGAFHGDRRTLSRPAARPRAVPPRGLPAHGWPEVCRCHAAAWRCGLGRLPDASAAAVTGEAEPRSQRGRDRPSRRPVRYSPTGSRLARSGRPGLDLSRAIRRTGCLVRPLRF
jgi:hypothetical protein